MNYVLILCLVVGVGTILLYNGMVRGRNMVDESWSGIDVQLKRRHDLIPNLVAAVRGYAAHEKAVFTEVTAARARALAAEDIPVAPPGHDQASRQPAGGAS